MSDRPESKTEARVWVVESGGSRLRTDQLATEEPLEIRLRAAGIAQGAGPLPVFRRRSERAVSLAREFGITLIGFLRGDRFNVYTGLERVRASRT